MPEAVIVAATRSPIGRAFKGALKDTRPDQLAATMVQAALDQVPELDPTTIDDLMLGCGMPGGRAGLEHGQGGRGAARPRRPARCDDHPLLLLQPADQPDGHARHPRRRGPHLHLRRRRKRQQLQGRRQRHPTGHRRGPQGAGSEPLPGLAVRHRTRPQRRPGGRRSGRVARPAGGRRTARLLHRDGPDRRKRRRSTRHHPGRPGRVRAPVADAGRQGRRERLLGQGDHPGDVAGRHRHGRRRGPAPADHPGRAVRSQTGVPGRRHRHRRQRLPA